MMLTIQIPTSAFACKIIFAQRGLKYINKPQKIPFALRDKDELFDLFKHNGRIRKQQSACLTLTHFFAIAVSERIASKTGGDMYAIGEHLDRFYKREMCKEVFVKVQGGSERVRAIREFYEHYELEEEDYAQEAAIKCVQRFFSRKKTPKLATKKIPNVASLLPISTKVWTEKELEAIYITYKNFYPFYFLTSRKKERKDLPNSCRVWIWKNIGNYANAEIAEKFGIGREAVWKRAKAFEQEFQGRQLPVPYLSAKTNYPEPPIPA